MSTGRRGRRRCGDGHGRGVEGCHARGGGARGNGRGGARDRGADHQLCRNNLTYVRRPTSEIRAWLAYSTENLLAYREGSTLQPPIGRVPEDQPRELLYGKNPRRRYDALIFMDSKGMMLRGRSARILYLHVSRAHTS